MKRAVIILVGILMLTVFLPVHKCESSNLLELKEGMKYEYIWQAPPADFSRQIDLYITEEKEDSWEGITAITSKDGTRLYRFKITKDDFELYTTTQLREKNIFDEEIDYRKITTASSVNPVIIPLVFALNKQIYGFDMEELIDNKSVTTMWSGGVSTNLTLEGPLSYKNYNSYKIIGEMINEPYTSTTTYYVSTVPPYLLIDQRTSIGGIENYVIINLETAEMKSFDVGKYNVSNPPNQHPQAKFSYSVDNLTVEFNASDSYDSDGTIISYEWDFDDGTNGTGINPIHEYEVSGNYRVKLYVYDDEGERGLTWKNIVVNASSINGEQETETPGFELVFALCAIAITLIILKRRKAKT